MSTPAIRIRHLTKDFRLGLRLVKLRAVDDLSFAVADNEVFGLLGPNGSGKSTTMKVILGLLEPTHGDCEIFGIRSNTVEARRLVGYLPEAPYFYRFLTGRELVAYYAGICGVPKREQAKRVAEVLELVDMTAAADRRVGTYSKGMLQRVGLAQAVVHDPRLVILDEPTAGVDPIGAQAIGDMIMELKRRGKTVLLCSHLLAQVEGVCNHVAILHKGKLVAEGAVADLLRRQGVSNLAVENLTPAARAEVEAALARHGAKLRGVGDARVALDEFFLSKISASKPAEKQERP
ncbi:MAG TPA: ABC transporter ATP-binding protein [Opitutales bacterium]|nr:ABC transporter ATP-binding protein [Opitutales bacterium]